MINPEDFLSENIQGANATSLTPIPAGEFTAVVTNISLRDFTYKKGDKAGMEGYALDVEWLIQDEEVSSDLGRDPKIRQSMILDFDGDKLDMSEGHNIGLGRLREALSQNKPGDPWNFNMLNGQVAVILCKQRMDGDDIYTDVNKVRAA